MALGREFRIIRSSTPYEGVRLAVRNRPDILLLDLHFSIEDPFSIVKRLRETPEIKNTPILLVSVDASIKTAAENKDFGVQDYIVKPYQSQALLEKVRALVKKGAAEGADNSEKDSS